MTRLDLSLHKGQSKIYDCAAKIRLVCSGRRFGKSRLAIVESLIDSLTFKGQIDPISPETVLIAMPTLVQARPIFWEPLLALAEGPLAPLVDHIDRQGTTIWFKNKKPPIRVRGANDRDGDGLRGTRILSLKGDEFQDWKPGILDSVILPAMADTVGSRALLTMTPKGTLSHAYEIWQRAEEDPETYQTFQMPTWTNPCIPRSEVERARKTMPRRLFRQEYMATWEDVPGMVYEELDENNLTSVFPDRYETVILGVDFGDRYPCVVSLGLSEGVWYVLEHWQGDGQEVIAQPVFDKELLRVADKHPYDRLGFTYCDPSRGASILGIRSLGNPLLRNAVWGYNPIEDGIQQVHSLIYQRRLMFSSDKTSSSYRAYQYMRQYHRPTDILGRPVPDKVADGVFAHCCDAIRYALAVKAPLA